MTTKGAISWAMVKPRETSRQSPRARAVGKFGSPPLFHIADPFAIDGLERGNLANQLPFSRASTILALRSASAFSRAGLRQVADWNLKDARNQADCADGFPRDHSAADEDKEGCPECATEQEAILFQVGESHERDHQSGQRIGQRKLSQEADAQEQDRSTDHSLGCFEGCRPARANIGLHPAQHRHDAPDQPGKPLHFDCAACDAAREYRIVVCQGSSEVREAGSGCWRR